MTMTTRRDVLRKAVYITPAILSLPALPSFAQTGSGPGGGDGGGGTLDCGGTNPVFCFFEQPDGRFDIVEIESGQPDPSATFCSCSS